MAVEQASACFLLIFSAIKGLKIKQAEACSTEESHGSVSAARFFDRRERAKLLPRRGETISHAARGQHRHSQAGRVGGPAAAGAWRAPGKTHRRRRTATRLRRAPAESARRNPEG